MIEPLAVVEEKGLMINRKKLGDRSRSEPFFLYLACGVLGLLGLGMVDKVLAQIAPSTVTFSYTGNAVPSPGQFTRVLPGVGLQAGPFRLHPFLGVAEIYTDNVFRTKSNREHDFVHLIAPGLQVQLPFAGRHQFVFDYKASQGFSQRFNDNNVLRQDLTGQFIFKFPGGLNFQMQGGYTDGFDLRGSAVDLQAPEPTKWNAKTFTGQADTGGTRLGMRVQFQATDWKFTNNNQGPPRDRISYNSDLTLFGLIAPKTFALVNAGISRQLYDQNTQLDSASFRVSSGLRWRATGKTRGEIQVGYEFLNFDHAPITQPAGSVLSSGGNGSQNLRITGSLTWSPTSRVTIGVRPSRQIRQSGVFNTSTFTQTSAGFNVNYAFGARTTINGSFRYSNNDFTNDEDNQDSDNRIDNTFNSRIGFTYRAVKWLGITGQYQYQQQFSTVDRFEYYANTIMVSIQGVF